MTFASKEDYEKHIESVNNITAYIEYFSNDSELFGEWVESTSSFPHIDYSQQVRDFLKALDDNGLITVFDWTTWEHGERIFNDHTLISSLEFMEIQFLLTTIVRKERFCEGFLLNAIKDGIILSALIQLETLYSKEENSLSMSKMFDEMEELTAKEEKFKKQNEKAKKLLENGTTIEPFYELSEELDLLKKISNNELIELNEFYITGIEYYDAKEIDFSEVKFLTLQLEPDNDYDTNAIEIYFNDMKVGYIPKEENSLIAKMMRQDVNIVAKVIEYNPVASLTHRIKVKLYQDGFTQEFAMLSHKEAYAIHKALFKKEPYVIGMFWNNPQLILENIVKALKNNKPYNEYKMLSKKERKAFDNGNLLF